MEVLTRLGVDSGVANAVDDDDEGSGWWDRLPRTELRVEGIVDCGGRKQE